MRRRFLQNATLVLALNFMVKGSYLLIVEREVQNLLPEGQYGLYFSLFNLSMLFQLVADFGLQQYNNRSISQQPNLLAKYLPHLLGIKLLLFLAYMLLVVVSACWLGYGADARSLLLIVAANLGLSSLLLFLRSNLSGLGRYRTDSLLSVLDKTLMLILVGSLVYIRPAWLNVERFAWAQTLSYGLAILVVIRLLWPVAPRLSPRIRWPMVAAILRRSAPYALVVLLMTAYTRLDAVMIERLLPDGRVQADHYAAAYRLLDALNMGGFLVAGLLLPMFSRLLGQGLSVVPLLRLVTPLVLGGAALISLVVACYAQAIVDLLYDFADVRTGQILTWLIPSFVAICGNYIYGSLGTAAGKLRSMNILFAGGVLLNILGNLWVLPRYGAVGCAAVTTITQSFVTLGLVVLAVRFLRKGV